MSRIKKTFAAVFVSRGLMAFRQILLVPILLKAWGVNYYGSWLILSAIPSFIAMSNLGLGTSAGIRIATRRGSDAESINRVTLVTSWAMIGSILSFIILLLSIWDKVYDSAFQILPNGFTILVCLVAGSFIRMLVQPLHGWWVAMGQAPRSLQLTNVFELGDLAIYLIVPTLGGNALVLVTLSLSWIVIWLSLYIGMSKRAGCKIVGLAKPSFQEARVLLKTGAGHQLSPLWQGLYFQGSIMLAGYLFGSTGAALWGALRVVNRAGNQLIEIISQTVAPEFQKNFAQEDLAANRILHHRAVLISILLSGVACASIMALGSLAFSVWTHRAFNVPRAVWWIMPLSLIPYSFWWVSGEYQRSTNRPWRINICGVFSALISLMVMFLASSGGVIGLSIGAFVFDLLMAVYVVPQTLRLLGESACGMLTSFRKEISEMVVLVSRNSG